MQSAREATKQAGTQERSPAAVPRSTRTEEMDLLRDYDPGNGPSVAGNFVWETDEETPRRVVLLGRSAIDPDVIVARMEAEEGVTLIMGCGSVYDGKIIGQEVTIRRRFEDRRGVTGSMTRGEVLAVARQRVADRYAQSYHKSAILRGEWDTGAVIQSEVAEIQQEMSNV